MFVYKTSNSFVYLFKNKIKVFSYLKFLLKSTNQHGVHSPYVYNYLTKGLYKNRKHFSNKETKSLKLIVSTVSYFDCKTVFTTNSKIHKNIQNSFKTISINEHHELFDLIIIENLTDYKLYLDKMKNDSLLIILNTQNQSKEIVLNQTDDCTLVLDFYYMVVVSKRKEQKRENFFLRY